MPDAPGFHLAFHAETRSAVVAFHQVGLAAGGKDNGAPGLRPIRRHRGMQSHSECHGRDVGQDRLQRPDSGNEFLKVQPIVQAAGNRSDGAGNKGKVVKFLMVMVALASVARGGEARTPLVTAADCWKVEAAALMGKCLADALPKAEAELDQQVAAAHQRFRKWAREDESKVRRVWINTAASELVKAQPAWRRYRDAHCASRDGFVTGNDHGMARVRCKLEMTTARIEEVMAYSGGSKVDEEIWRTVHTDAAVTPSRP